MSTSAELIAIGNELLDGRVSNEHAVFLGDQLKFLGCALKRVEVVGDHLGDILQAFDRIDPKSSMVFVTGGLGPTSDDVTNLAISQFTDLPLQLSPEAFERLKTVLSKWNRPVTPQQRKQVELPRGVDVLSNSIGLAPGYSFKRKAQTWFVLPGVPSEMHHIFQEQVLPRIQRSENYKRYSWVTQFVPESLLQEQLESILVKLPPSFHFSFRTHYPEVQLCLSGVLEKADDSALFTQIQNQITDRLGESVFSTSSGGIEPLSLEERVISEFKTRQWSLATVESCTGGRIAQRITRIPGSSEVFLGSWVVYHNALKAELGVDPALIAKEGAVSAPVSEALVRAALQKMELNFPKSKTVVVSTTGIAGPEGGSPEKPVGLCYLGLGFSGNKRVWVDKLVGPVGRPRDLYQKLFTQKALDFLRRYALGLLQ